MSSGDERQDEDQMRVDEEQVAANEEKEEEEEEEVYVVEKVVNHRKRGNKTQYFLKWKGYPEEDNTWEDEDNLFCHELIEEYLKSKEIPQNTPGSKNTRKPAKRAKSDSSDEDVASPTKKPVNGGDPESWEDQVKEVETVERDESDQLKIYLIWKNGKRTVHNAEDANRRCPQKVIKFYESHLKFKVIS
ncbi:chromo domain-like protein [Basidiobolus meristosporus CBS 931.73]|uniref:Chromo domain-like protein n=1 Tax=Basidiobolus meristosporus CBS 931.73 TaxID=1314790 RepID=A0A1Y1Z282_9FUNG|nr:chromo domain-like protein [Basidiobolus meristosporus CBS 931.73]|eukprot:ORY04402.1 chromo domain-like protein [Basidiobolus meristosporus CBS 931.73]